MKEAPFAEALRDLMQRPRYTATPGIASKLSGVPRATIVNWLEGRVARPRKVGDLRRLADALRFDEDETAALFAAARWPIPDAHPLVHPALPTAAQRSLPEQLTSLIGREGDLALVVAKLLDEGVRLVTLIGPGGVGKTHLAIDAAGRLREGFPDGVVWISFANVNDPALVVAEIARALGIHDAPGHALQAATQTLLRTTRVLLLIDNFEQVVAAAGVLTELLAATEHVKLLVTSRFSLRLRGEHELRVEPLARPRATNLPALEQLAHFPAVALFAARARAAQRHFVLDDSNAADVAAICERVDGLPLALELAAAQSRTLATSAIAQRLSHPLLALVDGSRDAASRHRSLRDTIAWSYELLDPDEQLLFRSLSVFADGISPAAAAAVNSTNAPCDPEDALVRLRDLVDRSLLSPSFECGEPRFNMLETIREFARERLIAAHEDTAARHAHGSYMLAVAQRSEELFANESTSVWSHELRLGHDDVRAALTWFIDERADPDAGARLTAALGRYWFERGHFLESRLWLERVVAADLSLDISTQAKLKLYLAFVANYDGDYATGGTMARAARDDYRRLSNRAGEVQALNAIGIAAMYTGDHPIAAQHFSEALAAYEKLGERRGVAVELHNLGEIAAECRFDFPAAKALYGRSLEIFTALGHTLNVGMTLGVLAECNAYDGNGDEARHNGEAALAAFRTLGNQPLIAEGLARLAQFAIDRGDVRLGSSLLIDSLDLLRTTANPRHHARCFEGFALLAAVADRPRVAARIAGFVQRIRRVHAIPALPAAARRFSAWNSDVRGHLGAARYRREAAAGSQLDVAHVAAEAMRLAATV